LRRSRTEPVPGRHVGVILLGEPATAARVLAAILILSGLALMKSAG